jgi:ribonuclease D
MLKVAQDHGDLSEANEVAMRKSLCVAWDIETTGLDWSSGKIATCQLHSKTAGTVLVRGIFDIPQRLRGLLTDPTVFKVFHHAPFDLRFMSTHWDARPVQVACTKIASRVLDPGLPSEEHSLKRLLARHLGIEIDKSERLSNWMAPELTNRQLAYAAADVEHLLPLLAVLDKELRSKGLYDIYRSCCEFLPTRVALEVGGRPDVFAY